MNNTKPCLCDCHAFWIGDKPYRPGATKCCPACSAAANEPTNSYSERLRELLHEYLDKRFAIGLNADGLTIASVLALNREYIGEDELRVEIGDLRKHKSINSGKGARNVFRHELRRTMGGEE